MLFNSLGRHIPSKNCRVFSDTPKEFYKLEPIDIDYASQHKMATSNGLLPTNQSLQDTYDSLVDIKSAIKENDQYQNLFQGLAIPFCFLMPEPHRDLGAQLEEFWLPLLKRTLNSMLKEPILKRRCKVILS